MTGARDMAEAVNAQHRADGFVVAGCDIDHAGCDVRFFTWLDGSLAALADPALTRLVAHFGNLRGVIEGKLG